MRVPKTGRGGAALVADRAAMPRSGIRAFMDLAWAAGDVIHLEVGEPNFATPPHVVEAAHRAALNGSTKYVPNAGVPELRTAIADKLRQRNSIAEARPDDVVVTVGGAEALYVSLLAMVEPGDGVLIPDPGWPNFRMIATLVGAEQQPYRLRPEDGFLPSLDELDRAATSATRAVIVNSPSNPLGTVLDCHRASELLGWAAERGIWVVSDECYDELVYIDGAKSLASLPGAECVVSCFSFSKTYAMTGWRVGYVHASRPDVVDLITKLQEPVIACVNAPAQAAAIAALTGPQEVVAGMRDAYRRRRDAAASLLRSHGVSVLEPAGAFYLWVDTAPWADDDWQLAHDLLTNSRVAVAPGSAFGAGGRGFLRLSLATEESVLLEGCRKILGHLSP